VELAVSPYATERSRDSRIARRRERLAQYFQGAQTRPVSLRQSAIYDLDLLAVGAILAFQDGDGLTLSLGVVEDVDGSGGTAMVRTPLESPVSVTSVRIGSARWDPANKREKWHE
jgi:polynucleotide 5'-kinase involved in rRNA processing